MTDAEHTERIPYGEHNLDGDHEVCVGCTAEKGELHDAGCDHERCPVCNGQLAFCGHAEEVLNEGYTNAAEVLAEETGRPKEEFEPDAEVPESLDSIEISGTVVERFERERKNTKTDHAPPMDPATFLSSLLDTQKAVREGYYDDD